MRGSSKSRRPSPSMLRPSTVMEMATPEEMEIHGPETIWLRPSLRMEPHVGSGGCTPMPRKLKPASIMMANAALSVARTTMGVRILGSTCLVMIQKLLAPSPREAMTNSELRMASTEPR